MAPLVEDMLSEARTGLTKAVVTGLGRAVLFYGRCSIGEGLMADEARDAAFLLTGAGTRVGKSAYLTTDPMTIQEGRRAIAHVISDNRVKARGPRHTHVNPLAQQPFWFNVLRNSPPKDMPGDGSSDYQPSACRPSRGHKCNRRQRDQRPQLQLQFLCLPWTVASRVIGVCYRQHLQCHPDLTVQMDQGIPDEVDDTEKKHA